MITTKLLYTIHVSFLDVENNGCSVERLELITSYETLKNLSNPFRLKRVSLKKKKSMRTVTRENLSAHDIKTDTFRYIFTAARGFRSC